MRLRFKKADLSIEYAYTMNVSHFLGDKKISHKPFHTC